MVYNVKWIYMKIGYQKIKILKKNERQLDYIVGIYNSVKDITHCYELFFSDFDTLQYVNLKV